MNILEVLINNPESVDEVVEDVKNNITAIKNKYAIGKTVTIIRFFVVGNYERFYYSPTECITRILKTYLRVKDIRFEYVKINIVGHYKARPNDKFYLASSSPGTFFINSFLSSDDFPGNFPTDYYSWKQNNDPYKYYDLNFVLQCFRLIDKDLEPLKEKIINAI